MGSLHLLIRQRDGQTKKGAVVYRGSSESVLLSRGRRGEPVRRDDNRAFFNVRFQVPMTRPAIKIVGLNMPPPLFVRRA